MIENNYADGSIAHQYQLAYREDGEWKVQGETQDAEVPEQKFSDTYIWQTILEVKKSHQKWE